MEIQEHVPLAPLTMFRIGGAARYFASIVTLDDARAATVYATSHSLPVFVLGGGSNILMSDNGFPGVVMHMKGSAIAWSDDDTLVVASAGASWDKLVDESVARERFGLENLSGIPGSVGGAVGGNIGAYGSEVSETLEWVEVFDMETMAAKRLSALECRLGYRESLFKQAEGENLVILHVAFRLKKGGELDRGYKDIAQYEKQEGEIATLKGMRAAVLSIRRNKFPSGGSIGTAGSFFKNPVVESSAAKKFLERFPASPNFPQSDGSVKLSAAWIIDNVLQLRGVREGNVGTWESQALVLVNYGSASSAEVKHFAQMIIDRAKKETHITLTPEVIIVNDESFK